MSVSQLLFLKSTFIASMVESVVSGGGEEGAGSAQAHYWLHTCLVMRMWMKIRGRRA